MPPKRVRVDGEVWYELSRHRTKTAAKVKAKKVRNQGAKARVRKFSFGYVVAVEPKSTQRAAKRLKKRKR